jgi:UPF0716 protein FxsA
MLTRLFLLFTVVPAVELYLLLQLGAWLGPTQTIGVILLTGVCGAWLAKREGVQVLLDLQQELQGGLPPASRLLEGALVVAGGLLLVTPGVMTDITGFAFILPPSRRLLAPALGNWLRGRFDMQSFSAGPNGGLHVDLGGPGAPRPSHPPTRDDPPHFEHPVA